MQRSSRSSIAVLASALMVAAAAPLTQPARAQEKPQTPATRPTTGPAAAADAGGAATISPEARTVVQQVQNAYTKLTALELAGTITSISDVAGESETLSQRFTGAFQAPNKFRHEFEDALVLGSTGEKLFIHNKPDKSYLLADPPDADATAQDMPPQVLGILHAQNPSLLLAMEDEPLKEFASGQRSVEKIPDVTIDGTKYTALRIEAGGGDHAEVTMLIDPRTHLIRRITADLAPALTQAGQPDVKRADFVIDYTRSNPNPQFGNDRFAWSPPEGAQNIAEARPAAQQASGAALVGQPAPPFKLDTLDGESVSLSDFKGQIVLLDFWASWCPPCVESLPHLGRMYGQKQDDVKVLAVNLQEDKEQVRTFAAAQGIDVPILLDTQGEVARKYNVSGIPQTVLIGKDGTVKEVFVGLGPDTYDQIAAQVKALKEQSAAATPAADKQGP